MPITLVQINNINRVYWAKIKLLAQNETVRTVASEMLVNEAQRNIPFDALKSDAEALLEAERYRKQFASGLGSCGGRSKKPDALQCLIVDLVRGNPNISLRLLETHIRNQQGDGIIEELDETTIHFIGRDGHSKPALIGGLKHRLTRARKFLQTR